MKGRLDGRRARSPHGGIWFPSFGGQRVLCSGQLVGSRRPRNNVLTTQSYKLNFCDFWSGQKVPPQELKNKPDLQMVVLQLFIMTITNVIFMGDRQTPFFICIDEAWDLLRGKQTGVFIETLARRLRKYRGSLIVGTQNIDDFFTASGAQAAYTNSNWKCILKQDNVLLSQLCQTGKLNFTESMQKAAESLKKVDNEYSEIMITDSQGNYSIVRLILDPFSQLLYSTTAEEYARLKVLTRSGKSIQEAINQVLKEGKHGKK